jgi:hypothetical protein
MPFKHFYDSPLAATVLPCIAAALILVVALRYKGLVRVYGVVFSVTTAADAFLNGPWTPVKPNTALATAVAVTFVIVGDFRYFVVLEAASAHGLQIVRSVVLAFVVPLAMQFVRATMPNIAGDMSSTFLVYEIFFFAFAAGIATFHLPRMRDVRTARWATRFELAQYTTWIVADIGLLTVERDVFWGVRTIANLMYYVACVPFMMRLLRESERRG